MQTSRFLKLDNGRLGYRAKQARVQRVDADRMAATFVITTESQDRDGDIVRVAGCKNHLDSYAANPRVLWNHDRAAPIGSARNPDGTLALAIFPGERIESTCFFHGKTRLSSQTFALVAAREVEAASIGFSVMGGVENNPDGRFVIDEWELLEWSVVVVPANAEAVRVRLGKGRIDGEPLAMELIKSLGQCAAKRTAWPVASRDYLESLKMASLTAVKSGLDAFDEIDPAPPDAILKSGVDDEEEEEPEEEPEEKADDDEEEDDEEEDEKADEEEDEPEGKSGLSADLADVLELLEELTETEGMTASVRGAAKNAYAKLRGVCNALEGDEGKGIRRLLAKAREEGRAEAAGVLVDKIEKMAAAVHELCGVEMEAA